MNFKLLSGCKNIHI